MHGRLVVTAVAAGLLLAGCAGRAPAAAPVKAADGSYVIDTLRARHEMGLRLRFHRNVAELLDNTQFALADGPAEPLTAAVVVADVVSVQRGVGFHVPGADAPRGTLIDYEDDRASWRTVHVDVAVSRVISGASPGTVRVGFSFDASSAFDEIAAAFHAMDHLPLFLSTGSPVFDYDPSLYALVEDWAYLGYVDADGTITLPALPADTARAMLGQTPTIDRLAAAAAGPLRLVHIDASGRGLAGG